MCAELRNCIECNDQRRRSRQQQAQAAISALTSSNSTLDLVNGLVSGLEVVVRLVQRVSRFVPQARVAGLALIPVERSLGQVAATIRATRAANEAALTAIRLAA